MNRFSLVAATLALSLFCTPNVVSATNSLPQTPSEWMDLLEKQSINQEDYGNSGRNFVTDSLPLVKDSAQMPDPNIIKIMIDPGHANYYNPSTVVNGYYESVMTWTLSNYLKEELEALGVQADLTKTSLEDDPDLQPRGHMSFSYPSTAMLQAILLLTIPLQSAIRTWIGQILMTPVEQLDSF